VKGEGEKREERREKIIEEKNALGVLGCSDTLKTGMM
jgi:hypothetical protein